MRFELRATMIFSLLTSMVSAACGASQQDCGSNCLPAGGASDGGAAPDSSHPAGASGAETPSDGGAAGAPAPSAATAGAGVGGAAGTAGSSDGDSGCVDAQCPIDTACAKDAAGCAYPAGERFVTYSGNDFHPSLGDLIAVPLSRLSKPIRLSFSDGLLDATFSEVGDSYWSPDGRRLVFPSVQTDNISEYEQKFYWLDARVPLSGPAQRISDLPINEDYGVESWSADANAFLIGDDTTTFAVRFTGTGTETSGVPSSGTSALCADDTLVAYAAADGTHIAALWDKAGKDTLLAADLLGGSPDGHWLLLGDDQHAYLAACAEGAKLETLGGPAAGASSWSSDSRFVAYSETADSPTTLSAWAVMSQNEHQAAFQATVADPTVKFRPGSDSFVYVAWIDETTARWHVDDLAKNSGDFALSIPDDVGGDGDFLSQVDWVHASNLLTYTLLADPSADAYVLEAVPAAKPRLVVRSDNLDSGPVFTRDGSKAVYVISGGSAAGATSQVYVLDLDTAGAKPQMLFHAGLTGSLELMDDEGRMIERDIDAPESRAELYVVPEDLAGEPVLVNGGTFVDTPLLQPQP